MSEEKVRLNKFIASAGICSRRKADELIEAGKVFVNGKQVYKREFKHEDDWRAPFIVPITEFIDWNRKNQIVTVRVEDNDGAGGIWQPVFLVRMP